MGTSLLTRTCTSTLHKINTPRNRDNVKSFCRWRVLRWAVIPLGVFLILAIILLATISVTYDLTGHNSNFSLTLDTAEEILLEAHSSHGLPPEAPDKDVHEDSLQHLFDIDEIEIVTRKASIEFTDGQQVGDNNDTQLSSGEDTFIDRLISSFQKSMNKEPKPSKDDLSVKQFPSIGETGYVRRIPNGHKYGEYQQALPNVNKFLGRSTTSLPVSPTLPSLQPKGYSRPTQPPLNYNESTCHSPQLQMCRGVIPWDLTTVPTLPGITDLESLQEALPYFELILESGCSPRTRQFLCALLEPECQPYGRPILPPCRKPCKVVAEDCSDFILAMLDLSKVFHCDNYPDSDDSQECVNFARSEKCLSSEMRCEDSTCIPIKWQCNGVKDCIGGIDEQNCTACSKHQFTCESKDKCIPLEWRCDGHPDCLDGSDESHCNREEDMVGHSHASPCPVGELRCVDGRCITTQQLCDGHKDCLDGADEANCRHSLS